MIETQHVDAIDEYLWGYDRDMIGIYCWANIKGYGVQGYYYCDILAIC